MINEGTEILISNDRIICPRCKQPLKIYGSALATEKTRFYAAECQNTECALLVRFEMTVNSVLRPSRMPQERSSQQER